MHKNDIFLIQITANVSLLYYTKKHEIKLMKYIIMTKNKI